MTPDYLETIARVCQAAEVTYRIRTPQVEGDGNANEEACQPWEKLPMHSKAEALEGIKFLLDNPHVGAAAWHTELIRQRTTHDWTYGTVFNAKEKTDPLLMPFGRLSAREQNIANLRRAIIGTMGRF